MLLPTGEVISQRGFRCSAAKLPVFHALLLNSFSSGTLFKALILYSNTPAVQSSMESLLRDPLSTVGTLDRETLSLLCHTKHAVGLWMNCVNSPSPPQVSSPSRERLW